MPFGLNQIAFIFRRWIGRNSSVATTLFRISSFYCFRVRSEHIAPPCTHTFSANVPLVSCIFILHHHSCRKAIFLFAYETNSFSKWENFEFAVHSFPFRIEYGWSSVVLCDSFSWCHLGLFVIELPFVPPNEIHMAFDSIRSVVVFLAISE